MTLYQFNMLDFEEQLGRALNEGSFVGDRIEGDNMVLLYQIDSFYVEVYYHPKSNEIMQHRSFSSTNQLESYLREINIEGIS